jgi:hypothetical protein
MRSVDCLPTNVDGDCSDPKALETQMQSESYALNEPESNSQLEMDLSCIIRNQSDTLKTRMDPGSCKGDIHSTSRAMDFEEIVSQFSESNQGNLLLNLR